MKSATLKEEQTPCFQILRQRRVGKCEDSLCFCFPFAAGRGSLVQDSTVPDVMSNHMWPTTAMSTAQHHIINLLKRLQHAWYRDCMVLEHGLCRR